MVKLLNKQAMLHYYDNIKKRIIIAFILALALYATPAHAQDPQFSQFYATSLYMAPSLAGSSNASRVTLNYRNQWPFIANGFQSYMVSGDHFFDKLNSGVGILAVREQAGSGNLSSTYIGAAYAYHVKLSRTWSVRPGIFMSYLQRNIDFSRLVFTDQLNSGVNTIEALEAPRINKLDFAASAIFFNNNIWFGSTFKHMTSPNISFTGEDMKLPRYFTFYAGSRITMNKVSALFPKGQYLYPNIQFQLQGVYKQLDAGVYWEINPILFGLRYRGIPVFKENAGSDALIFLAGVKQEKLTISYSYDLTISKLMGAGGGGAHEIVMIFNFNQDVKLKRRPMPCPHCASENQ